MIRGQCSSVSMRLLLSAALSAMTLVGCYDLSDPTGPRRNDFVRTQSPTQTQEQGQTQASSDSDQGCSGGPCAGNKAALLDSDAPPAPPSPAATDDEDGDGVDAMQRLRVPEPE